MDNQNLGRVSMQTANRPRKPFPMRGDTFTSCGFGDCQPVMFEDCQPNTENVVSHDVLVRLAPLLAPVRSRLGVRLLTKFVGMSELTENYPYLMADKPVSRGSNVFIPRHFPSLELRLLSALCLVGAKVSVYLLNGSSSDTANFSTWQLPKIPNYTTNLSSWTTYLKNLYSVLGDIGTSVVRSNADSNSFFSNDSGRTGTWASAWNLPANSPMINIGRALAFGYDFWIPVTEPEPDYMFRVDNDISVPLDGKAADFVIPVSITGNDTSGQSTTQIYGFAFKMSTFGARIRKILIGCGYQLDFYSASGKSLMPLFAYYKAYYDSFGLMLYENWENTSVYRLLFDFESKNTWALTSHVASGITNDITEWLVDFAHRLGTTFYTEEQDFVSAHLRELSVSNSVLNVSMPFASVPNSPTAALHVTDNLATDTGNPSAAFANSGHASITGTTAFSQLDLEAMKKAYQVVNRNTIAGQRIAEILRANGLGSYVDECKSSFVGESYVPIDINDVNATADSFNTATGQQSTLGDYVGKGVGYNASQNFKYSNKEYGYLITIACVIPESGYCQQEDPLVNCTERDKFYLPDFDGMGFEANTKRILCAQQDFGDWSTRGALDATFGFVPRMSKFKVSFNRLNGDFSRRSTRDGFLPYSLDKFIEVGERAVDAPDTTSTYYDAYGVTKGFKATDLPCATPNLRFVGRLPWLGNYTRVFNLEGKITPWNVAAASAEGAITDEGIFVRWEYVNHREVDNFMLFVFRDYKQEAPMLQIEDSFETREDGNKGSTDISIGKA